MIGTAVPLNNPNDTRDWLDSSRLFLSKSIASDLCMLNVRVQQLRGAQRSNVGCIPLLGFATMSYCDDYIPLFVSFLDIPVSFGSLF